MKSLTDKYYVESAATTTEEIGNGIYPNAREQLKSHGIGGYKDKVARQVTRADYDKFDYLVIMDEENRWGLKRIVGDDKDGKIHKLLEFAGLDDDISDPWYTRDFDLCFNEIYKGCEGMIKFIEKNY